MKSSSIIIVCFCDVVSILLPLETGHEDLQCMQTRLADNVSILLPLETGHEAASPFNPLKINKLYPYLSIIKSFLQHVKEHSFTHFSFVFRNLKYLFISILQSK